MYEKLCENKFFLSKTHYKFYILIAIENKNVSKHFFHLKINMYKESQVEIACQ